MTQPCPRSLFSGGVRSQTLCRVRGKLWHFTRLEDANRQYHRVQSRELKASLKLIGRLVVQYPLIKTLALENQLSEKEEGLREVGCDSRAEFLTLIEDVSAYRHS